MKYKLENIDIELKDNKQKERFNKIWAFFKGQDKIDIIIELAKKRKWKLK